jgi:hypothetical protein
MTVKRFQGDSGSMREFLGRWQVGVLLGIKIDI